MPLEFRRQRNGSIRDVWFGAFELNGKRYGINLGVKISGNPPASLSLKDEGDTAYEKSRTAALSKLEHFIEEARKKNHSEHLVEKLYEIKTGEVIKSVKLEALGDEWAKIPRRRTPNARYASQCASTLTRFAVFVRQMNPKVTELAQVTRTGARAFLEAEAKRGVTGKTWNDLLKLLRATFRHLLPAGGINPFADVPSRETETVFRHPFSPEELAAISEAARSDELVRPIIVAGMCTAMRRGDCCLLDWKDVDLEKRFITVKTSKTGQTVSIPIFPMLQDELRGKAETLKTEMLKAGRTSPLPSPRRGEEKREGYVFPEAAAMYLENPDGITWRVKKVLAVALGAGSEEHGAGGKAKNRSQKSEMADLQVARNGGLRRASVRDFHSFRVTWVTLALTAGVPLELVQKVTGHKTTDIVLKHYFQPGREAFRDALQKAMPALLTNGASRTGDQKTEDGGQKAEVSKRDAEMREIIERVTPRTWKRDKERLLKMLKG